MSRVINTVDFPFYRVKRETHVERSTFESRLAKQFYIIFEKRFYDCRALKRDQYHFLFNTKTRNTNKNNNERHRNHQKLPQNAHFTDPHTENHRGENKRLAVIFNPQPQKEKEARKEERKPKETKGKPSGENSAENEKEKQQRYSRGTRARRDDKPRGGTNENKDDTVLRWLFSARRELRYSGSSLVSFHSATITPSFHDKQADSRAERGEERRRRAPSREKRFPLDRFPCRGWTRVTHPARVPCQTSRNLSTRGRLSSERDGLRFRKIRPTCSNVCLSTLEEKSSKSSTTILFFCTETKFYELRIRREREIDDVSRGHIEGWFSCKKLGNRSLLRRIKKLLEVDGSRAYYVYHGRNESRKV